MREPYLRLIFTTPEVNREYTIRIPDPKDDLTTEDCVNAANLLIEKNIFNTEFVDLKRADVVSTDTEKLYPSE